MNSPARTIDEIRQAYTAGQLDRVSALVHIRGQVDVTEIGAADLLDHPDGASVRYGRVARSIAEGTQS